MNKTEEAGTKEALKSFLKQNEEHHYNFEEEIDYKILLNFFKYFDNSLQDILKNSIPSTKGSI